MKTVCWFSTGVSSFIACYFLMKEIDEIIYIHIKDQHPDSIRFLKDCESKLQKTIRIIQPRYPDVESVCKQFRFINSAYGAKCTDILKRRTRKEWEAEQADDLCYVWGMDLAEKQRAERLVEAMPNQTHRFPLIENNITKEVAHGMSAKLGLKRPMMYDLGYPNNNCIGCIKGGMGYWNKIREDFPDVFKSRSELERIVGHTCIKDVYLDELKPEQGREQKIILEDCGIFCEVMAI